MLRGSRTDVLRHLQRLVHAREARDLTDGELLGRFVDRRDEAAFAVLVQRHGPMVLGCCTRVLGNAHQAEDAFQATFLVLVRRAGSIRKRQSLGSWLYGVALRIARRERARVARRAARERQAGASPPGCPDDAARRELRAVLEEELGRLPEKYRAPLVLCYLEGRTQEQAAGELGCPRSTLASRLAAAQALLRKRLTRRDIAVTGGVLSSVLAARPAPAEVPALLVLSTSRAAAAYVGNGATAVVPSTPAVRLAESVGKTPVRIKLWLAGFVLAGFGLAVAGVSLVGQPSGRPGAEPEPRQSAPPAKPLVADLPREKGARDLNGDPLPAGALARMGTERLRHGASQGLLSFSLDGGSLISGGHDGVVHFWDVQTGKELRQFKTHPQQVLNPALSPDQRLLAATDFSGAFGLWDVASGKRLDRIKPPETGRWTRLAFSPDSKVLALGDTRSVEILLFDADSGRPLGRFQPQAKPRDLTRLGFSPDGTMLLAKSSDGVVHFWDIATGKELRHFRSNENLSPSYAVAPDGKTLAFAESFSVVLWDLTAEKKIAELRERSSLDTINGIAYSPDGRTLAAAGFRSVKLWDVAARKQLHQLGPFQVRGAYLLRFSPDGKSLATAGDQESIRLWDVATGRERRLRPEGHSGAVRAAAFAGDGKYLATLGADTSLRLWESDTGRPLAAVPVGGECMLVDRDGKSVLVNDEGCSVRYIEAASGREVRKVSFPQDAPKAGNRRFDDRRILGLALPPGGNEVTALAHTRLSDQPRVEVTRVLTLDPDAGRETFRGPARPERCQWALSPDGRLQASYYSGRRFDVRDVKSGKLLFNVDGKCLWLSRVAFSPDGRILAGVCHHGRSNPVTVAVWELATGAEVHRFRPALKGDFVSLAFAPGGRVLAAGGDAESGVQLWDLASGRDLVRYQGCGDAVVCLGFSPDGRRLAGGLINGTALVWDCGPAARHAAAGEAGRAAPDLESVWTDLGKPEARAGQAAVWSLADRPEQAIPLLRARLRPAGAADAGRIRRLLADLDSDRFEAREAASKELESLEQQADAVLRKAVTEGTSAEVRRRVEQVLARPSVARSPDTLRRLRSVQALETIGSAEARDLLGTLAAGDPDALETEEARAALQRLAGKPRH